MIRVLARFFVVGSFVLFCFSIEAAPSIAVVDGLFRDDPDEKEQILEGLRRRLSQRTSLRVLAGSEIRQRLRVENLARTALEAEQKNQEERYQKVKSKFDEARSFYLASRFDLAVEGLQKIFSELSNLSLVVEAEFAEFVLLYLVASHLFLEDQNSARRYLSILHAVKADDEFSRLDSFPPFIQEFVRSYTPPSFARRRAVPVQVEPELDELLLLGMPQRLYDKNVYELPVDHPDLRDHILVLKKSGYVSQELSVSQVARRVTLETDRDRIFRTEALFGVIGTLTASPQLTEVLRALDVELVVLLEVSKSSGAGYVSELQWIEPKTDRRSPTLRVNGADRSSWMDASVSELLRWIGPDGRVIEGDRSLAGLSPAGRLAVQRQPLYEKWWFWTLVGVGAAGLGVGGYFLLKPDDELRFSVRAGQ